jgi:hypothetical protein
MGVEGAEAVGGTGVVQEMGLKGCVGMSVSWVSHETVTKTATPVIAHA